MEEQDFLRLQKKISEELNINDVDILLITTKIPKMYNNYLMIYLKELEKHKILLSQKDVLYKEKYHYYKFNYSFSLDTKAEIEAYVKGDDKYSELILKINKHRIQLDYLEKTLDNISGLKWNIKNYIEIRNFQEGK
jgi:hypothetical protein